MPEGLMEKEPLVEKRGHRSPADMLEESYKEGVELAKKIKRTTAHAAEDLIEDTTHQIKRHPAGSVLGALFAGIVIGGIAGLLLRRK